ncbi:MAG: hypothetical protein WA001_00855 [Patescibacteria group bacterium]
MPRKKIRNYVPIAIGVVAVLVAAALVWRFSPETASRVMSVVLPQSSTSSTGATQAINPGLQPQAAAVVDAFTGMVTLVRASSTLAVFSRMKLLPGDIISVPADGSLDVIWPNYGRTEFSGGTVFLLVQAFESTDQQRFLVRVALASGRAWSRIERALGSYSGFSFRIGNVLVATPGASFGITTADGSATVQSLESYTDVFRVSDQPTSAAQHQQGVVGDTVEVPQGDTREIAPGQEVTLSISGTDLPKATAMSDKETADPFVIAGDLAIPLDDLSLTPLPGPTSSTTPGA